MEEPVLKLRKGLLETTLERSSADHFELAKLEWKLQDVVFRDDKQHCVCGQPIKECCILYNESTRRKMLVGNNCVERFFNIDTMNIFELIKKLEKCVDTVIPVNLIDLLLHLGYIYDTEVKFLTSISNNKILSEKQLAWKSKIVFRILNKTVVRKADGT